MDASPDHIMVALEREHEAALERSVAANQDLPDRVRALGAMVYYDPEDDVLLLTVGKPAPAITETVDDFLLLRLEPETWKIIGVEILGLHDFLAAHPEAAQRADGFLAHAKRAPGKYVELPLSEAEAIGELIRA